MGRPSKLTDKQWEEIGRRLLKKESVRKLAKEFGVSASTIQERFSERHKKIKEVADQLSKAEIALSVLPVSEQISARTLADELKAVSSHLASAARYGSMTAHRLAAIANQQTEKIDEVDPKQSMEVLAGIAGLTKMSNEAASTGLNLLRANQTYIDQLNVKQEAEAASIPNDSDWLGFPI